MLSSFDIPDDLDKMIERVEDDVRRAQHRSERLSALQDAVNGVRRSAASRERDLEVEVDSSGVLIRLQIEEDALDRGGKELANEIFSLIESARKDAREATLAVASELMGDDDPVLNALRSEIESGSIRQPGSGAQHE